MQRWQFILLAVVLAWFLPASAHAHTRPSQAGYDAEPPVEIVVFVAGITMDTYQGTNEDPKSLHKYLYVEDDAVNQLDFLGLDVYKIIEGNSSDAGSGSSIHHRVIVGDDGHGGYYEIDFYPIYRHWYFLELAGPGFVYCTGDRGGMRASEAINRYKTPGEVSVIVKTDAYVDTELTKEAITEAAPGNASYYIFLLNDCGTFANNF